jgi:hypothetical protein
LVASLINYKPPQSPAVKAVVEAAAKATIAHLQPTPTPGPSVSRPESSARAPEELFRPATTAPRAVLVKLPPPRAELVRLPEWRIGEERPVMMPYNLEVRATYKGRLGSEKLLPLEGNQLGDMWVVGDTPWIWLWAPGAATASWIDP